MIVCSYHFLFWFVLFFCSGIFLLHYDCRYVYVEKKEYKPTRVRALSCLTVAYGGLNGLHKFMATSSADAHTLLWSTIVTHWILKKSAKWYWVEAAINKGILFGSSWATVQYYSCPTAKLVGKCKFSDFLFCTFYCYVEI